MENKTEQKNGGEGLAYYYCQMKYIRNHRETNSS